MFKRRKKAGIVYSVKNKVTGEFYIGTTTSKIEERKKDHQQKAKSGSGHVFQKAISTYGIDAFDWQEIDTANSIDELAQKEKQFIIEYKSKDEGLNSDCGGGFKKTVYQYNLVDGKLLNTYSCLTDAGNAINATKQSISSACLNVNNTYGGFYWSYEFPFYFNIDKRFKAVEQLGNEGEVQAKYKSIAEASKITGVNKSSIAKACRGEYKRAGGLYWRKLNNFKMIEKNDEES